MFSDIYRQQTILYYIQNIIIFWTRVLVMSNNKWGYSEAIINT